MALDFLSDINQDYKEVMNYDKVDRLMVKILWWHFGVIALMAFLIAVVKVSNFYPSPFSWRVISIQAASVVIFLGLIASLVPHLTLSKLKVHYHWRLIVTTALTIYSYLLVFISGGSIEMHFHFFMMVALLLIYADWRLGWLLLVLTGLHHVILNYVEPGWVYFYGRNDFAVIAHAVPVLVAVIFTTIMTIYIRNAFVDLYNIRKGLEVTVTEKTNELQEVNQNLEEKVNDRTTQLQEKLNEVQELNEVMVGRELKLADQKRELDALKKQLSDSAAA